MRFLRYFDDKNGAEHFRGYVPGSLNFMANGPTLEIYTAQGPKISFRFDTPDLARLAMAMAVRAVSAAGSSEALASAEMASYGVNLNAIIEWVKEEGPAVVAQTGGETVDNEAGMQPTEEPVSH